MKRSLYFVDALREDRGSRTISVFTWWSYRAADWQASQSWPPASTTSG